MVPAQRVERCSLRFQRSVSTAHTRLAKFGGPCGNRTHLTILLAKQAPPRVVLRPKYLLALQPLIPTRRPFVAVSPSRRFVWMKTVLLKTMPGPISIVRDLKTLLAIPVPAVHLVPRTFETMRHNCIIEIRCYPQPLILLASDAARCKALVIRRASHPRHRSERGSVRSAHD
jgi:hypothetical protein